MYMMTDDDTSIHKCDTYTYTTPNPNLKSKSSQRHTQNHENQNKRKKKSERDEFQMVCENDGVVYDTQFSLV